MTDVVDPFKNPLPPEVAKGEIADPFAPGYVAPDTSVGDVIKSAAGGAVQAVGSVAAGAGNLIAQGVNRGAEAITGRNPMISFGDPLKPVSDAILDSRTPGGKLAMELSTPSGNTLKPETWSLGDAPTIGGYLQQTANVAGQFAPQIALAAATGGASLPMQMATGAGVGFLQAAGAAATEEGAAIRSANQDALLRDSKTFREYLAKGMAPAEARERTALDVELGAGTIGAVPAALEGAVLRPLIGGRFKMPTIGTGPISRAASAVAGGAVAEGAQETSESVAQKIGANVGGGMEKDITENSFASTVLGALGGAAGGGGIHALNSGSKAPESAKPQPAPEQKLLPAPGAVPIQAGEGGDVSDPGRMLEAQARAQELYAARDKVEAEKAAFASNGPISAAAVGAVNAGVTQQAQAKREADIAEALNPAQPLALPAPVAEQEKLEQKKVDEYLANKDSTSLTDAQRKSFEGEARGHNLVVVPHPSGKGYTTIPASKLSDRQQRAVQNIQRPDQSQLPSPRDEMPGQWIAPEGRTPEPRTYGDNNAGMRAEMDRWRSAMGTPVPKQMPIDDEKRAAAIAERKTQETGREHKVVAHPLSASKFAVAPVPTTIDAKAERVQDSAAFTGREQPAGVNSASQEAPQAQPAVAGVANDQADVAGAPAVAGQGPAAEAPQAEGVAPAVAGTAPEVNQELMRSAPDSAFNGDLEQGLQNIFLSDEHDGSPVLLANAGFTPDEVASLQAAGMADGEGRMSRQQFSAWSNERGLRLSGGRKKSSAAEIAARADEAATSLNNDLPQPSAAQASAGNYKKGHVKLHGLDISIENPAGSVRVAKDGSWASAMPNHYGYIRRTEGNDGDHVDTFIGPKPESKQVFIVDQLNPKTGEFDEHKVLIGFETQEQAEAGYKAAYPADWKGMGTVTATTVDGLKEWVKAGDTKAPFAPGAAGKTAGVYESDGFMSTSLDFSARPVTTADPKSLGVHQRLFGEVSDKAKELGAKTATPEEARALAAVVQEALRLGLPESALHGIDAIGVMDGVRKGLYLYDSNTVLLTREDLLLGARGNKLAAIGNVGKLIHEISHHFTGDNHGRSFAASSPVFKIGRNLKGERVARGAVMAEVYERYQNGPKELQEFLHYPLGSWGKDLLSKEGTLFLQDELMAQLQRLYYTNERLLRREMPMAFALTEELHHGISEAQSIAEARATVRRTLRSWTPTVSVRAGKSGADDTARGGDQDGRAGAGMDRRAGREQGGPGLAEVPATGGRQGGRGLPGQDGAGPLDARRPAALEVKDPERIVKNDLTKEEQGILAAKKGKIRETAIENFSKVFDTLPSVDEFAAAAWSGRAKRGWYRHSAEAIAHVFGPDAPRFTALLASLSPQTSVENNLENALRVWRGWVAEKRPTDRRSIMRIAGENVQGNKGEESVLDAWVNNMHRALLAADPIAVVLSGPKVDSFMRNLLGNVQEVTNDAWMANFALVDQTLFAGTGIKEATRDPGKGYGYLAFSARVRQAAKRLTKLTGEIWTPAEVQETVWSWAKTVLEQAQSEGVSSVDFLKSGKLTDELINATPDFRTLFHGGTYERILEQAGLGERVKSLRAAGQPDAGSGTQVAGAGSQAAPFARETQARLDERNAARIDKLRAQRAAEARATERDNARTTAVHALRQGEPAYAAGARNGKGAGLPVTLGGEKFVPLQTLTPSAAASAALAKANADAPIVHELPPAAAGAFRTAIAGTMRGNKYASSVYVYDEADYAKMRLFITHGGKAGFALKGDDIVSVFSYGKVRQASSTLLHLAVQMGGRRLDAFDTVLPKIYADHGFVPAARVRWDDEQAPPNWDKKLYAAFRGGEPDVVFMAYDPEFFGEYKKNKGKPMQYDEAVQAQADAVLDIAARAEYREEARRPNVMAVDDGVTQTPAYRSLDTRQYWKEARETAEYKTLLDSEVSAREAYEARRAQLLTAAKKEVAEKLPGLSDDQLSGVAFVVLGEKIRAGAMKGEADAVESTERATHAYVTDWIERHQPTYSPFDMSANQHREYYNSSGFNRWFRASKAVGSDGMPLVAFHGTDADIDEFSTSPRAGKKSLKTNPEYSGELGSWFAAPSASGEYDEGNAEATADVFAELRDSGGATYPVHLSIQNPMEYEGWYDFSEDRDDSGSAAKLRARLESEGYDGVVIRESDTDGGQFRDDWVAFHPTQIKSAIGNNGNFDARRPSILEVRDNEPLWYSQLGSAVETKAPFAKDGTIPAGQLRMWLAARSKDGGIKAEELKWSGLDEFLSTKDGRVSRADVKSFLDQNGVKITETTLGEAQPPTGWTVYPPNEGTGQARWVMSNGPVTGYGDSAQDAIIDAKMKLEREARRWQKNGDEEKAQRFFAQADEFDAYMEARAGVSPNGGETTKFSSYVLPGGENYRELLLTLPLLDSRTKIANKLAALKSVRASSTDQSAIDDINEEMRNLQQLAAADPLTRAAVIGGESAKFRSSHFDQPNILAHVRFNERTDAEGKRVLFIEEIQSDWAQKGRKEGFGGRPEPEKLAALPADVSLRPSRKIEGKSIISGANAKEYSRIVEEMEKKGIQGEDAVRAIPDGDRLIELDDHVMQRLVVEHSLPEEESFAKWLGIVRRYVPDAFERDPYRGQSSVKGFGVYKNGSRIAWGGTENDATEAALQIINEKAREDWLRSSRVPAAPFVGRTEAWVALALKRMIRYAADNGFDRIAWTTGEQQAERYDLSKQIDSVKYSPNGDGTFNVFVLKGHEIPWSDNRATPKVLEDTLGKDIAKKIADDPNEGILRGLDLKVGGEGMRAFYDKIVPNVANDLLKKMGGGRVAELNLGSEDDRRFVVAKRGQSWRVMDTQSDGGEYFGPAHKDARDAIASADKLNGATSAATQPGFDITPDMEPEARRPQAMFVNTATVTNAVQDLLTTSRSFNLWDRTVGTQLNKALKNAQFKKVYDGVQAFLNDSSQMMMEAADLAPDLLPKLDGIGDIFKLHASKADLANVSGAVFDGTINDVVYSDAELRTRGLNDKQIGLYRQARAAIDKSLSDAVASEAVKQAKGLLPQSVLDQAKAAGDAWVVVNALSALTTRTPVQQQVYDQLRARAAEVSDMQTKGYAPLQRFGQYTVHVVNPDGSSALFTMHESEREANAFARAARSTLQPGQRMAQGVMSEEAWKLFNGVSPDTLEVFAQSIGASQSQVMQSYIKLAANNRSVLKRMLQRKEIAGFQTDIQRTLAQFITSNARAAAKNYHWGEVLKATNDIPKEAGDVKDEAVRLKEYMETTKSEAGALRGLLFIQFLGGSVASAITNATQPVMMTFPWLSQFGGAAKAAAQLTRASSIALGGKTMEPALKAAMDRATKEGIVAPHEVAGLYAESIRNFGSNMAVRRGLKVWGSMFSLAEAFNRRITFVAAYRTAVEQNMPDPYEFATRAIAETQGVYNKGNRPNWARGAVGATLFTFKQYSVAYVEMLNRLPAKQKALALAVLVLASGLQGLPGADDLEDVIDTIAESLGYSFNSKKQLREWAARTLGDTAGGLLTHGVSSLPGVPIDVSARLGLGNLIPGTALFKRSETNKSRDVLEIFGPAGSQAQSFVDAFSAAQEGNPAEVFKAGVPLAIKNALKGLDMAQAGFYKDMKGRRVMDVDGYDAMMKGIGFQPQSVAKQSRVVQDLQQDINLAKDVESALGERMARAIVEHDPDALQKARVDLFKWNQTNPQSRIQIMPSQIQRRVRELMSTREQRFVKASPREMRVQVQEELRQ